MEIGLDFTVDEGGMEKIKAIEEEKPSILVVDNEEIILRALSRILKKEFYVYAALSGAEGLEILRNNRISLIIADNRMPGMGGVEFLREASRVSPDSIRFLLTGYTDLDVMGAIHEGVVLKYITKPWDNDRLKSSIREALLKQSLVKESKELITEGREQLKKVLKAVGNLKES